MDATVSDATASDATVPDASDVPSDALSDVPSDARPRSAWTAFPLVSYANETHLALGGFGVYFFRLGDAPAESRPSYVATAVEYTTRGQALFDLLPELWWDHESWLVTGQISYYRFPDSFFGIGNDTRPENEERFLFNTFSTRFDLRRRITGPLFVGLRQELQAHSVEEPAPNGFFARGGIPGQEGGVRSGAGPMLILDSRDNTLATHSGLYYLASLVTFQPWTGSDYAYTRFILDARHYYTWRERHTLAVQLYASLADGDVPFQAMALIGGRTLMRGYFEGRFRDRNLLMAQAEYRLMPLIWRFGVVAFATVGEVAPTMREFRWERLHWTVGAGLRFALNPAERIHLRFDAGVAADSWGLYANVLEVF